MPLIENRYAVGALSGGLLLSLIGFEFTIDIVWQVGVAGAMLGGAVLAMNLQAWYCAACGQMLGRGEKPGRCDRCGSNRVTTNDPGAQR